MRLEDFISETLKEILRGVSTAQAVAAELGGQIVPGKMYYQQPAAGQMCDYDDGVPVSMVDFDVAVTTIEGTSTQGGIGVFVGPLALGAQGQSEAANQSVSRIQFAVPLKYPPQTKTPE